MKRLVEKVLKIMTIMCLVISSLNTMNTYALEANSNPNVIVDDFDVEEENLPIYIQHTNFTLVDSIAEPFPAWNSSTPLPDTTGATVASGADKGYAIYEVTNPGKVTYSSMSWNGSGAYGTAGSSNLARGTVGGNKTVYLSMMDPVNDKVYVKAGEDWYMNEETLSRFEKCNNVLTAPEDPSRLVPYGLSVLYTEDDSLDSETVWTRAERKLVSSVQDGWFNFYETFESEVPEEARYVKLEMNLPVKGYASSGGSLTQTDLSTIRYNWAFVARCEIEVNPETVTKSTILDDFDTEVGYLPQTIQHVNFTLVDNIAEPFPAWNSSTPLPDTTGATVASGADKGYAIYEVTNPGKVTYSSMSWNGSGAYGTAGSSNLARGTVGGNKTVYLSMMDPVNDKVYVKAGEDWYMNEETLSRFEKCNNVLTAPEDPSRLVPYGLSVLYTEDDSLDSETVWTRAERKLVSSVQDGWFNFYETFESEVPEEARYVKLEMNLPVKGYASSGGSLTQTDLSTIRYNWAFVARCEIEVTSYEQKNTAPIAEEISKTGFKNESISGMLMGSDENYDPLTYQIVGNPEHGTVTLSGKEFVYHPDRDYYGKDSFTYKVNDGKLSSGEAKVILNILDKTIDDCIVIPKVTELTLPSVISNGMMFQQNKEINVWGVTTKETKVTVKLYNSENELVASKEGTSNFDGLFEIQLPEQKASFNEYKLEISDGKTTKTITNILIGEVWYTAGQSNMEMLTPFIVGGKELVEQANNSNIRMYIMPTDPASNGGTPVNPQFDYKNSYWGYGNKSNDVSKVSGVAYTYALELFEQLNSGDNDIPVSVIHSSMGAISIEWYMSRRSIENNEEIENYLKENNKFITKDQWNNSNVQQMSAYFNAKVAPISKLNIAGFLWYQGENNFGDKTSFYANCLDAMAKDWSAWFNSEDENLPFVFTHVAPHNYGYDLSCGGYMSEAMSTAAQKNKDTMAQVAIYDLPLVHKNPDWAYDHPIHPNDKKPVGERLAHAALELAYDIGKDQQSPVYKSYEINGDKIIVTFDYVGDGLQINDNETLHGFTIAGIDGKFVSADAKIISKNKVEVSSEFVENPKYVAYAFTTLNMNSNLENSNGLPCIPFRTAKVDGNFYHPQDWAYADDEQLWINTGDYVHNSNEGGAYYAPSWEGYLNNPVLTFDEGVKSEGNASLKVTYKKGATVFGPILGYPGIDDNLNKFNLMAFDVKNSDDRSKTLKGIRLTDSEGNVYFANVDGQDTSTITIEAYSDFETYVINLNQLVDSNNQLKVIKLRNISKIEWVIVDDEAGCLYIDNIRFGYNGNILEDDTIVIDTDTILTDEFEGFGIQWDPSDLYTYTDEQWASFIEKASFLKPNMMRVMLHDVDSYCVGFDANNKPIYDWDSVLMERFYRILDFAEENNIPVMIGEWCGPSDRGYLSYDNYGKTITWDNQTWSDMIVDCLEHLTSVKGYTCIRYYNMINEPQYKGGHSENTQNTWLRAIDTLRATMDASDNENIKKIQIVGPDVYDGWESWLNKSTSVETRDNFGLYEIHWYATNEDVYDGKVEETLTKLREQVEAKDPNGKEKGLALGEMGVITGRTNGDQQLRGRTYQYGVEVFDMAIQAMRAGMIFGSGWGFEDSMHIQASDVINNYKNDYGPAAKTEEGKEYQVHTPTGDVTIDNNVKIWGFWNELGEEMAAQNEAAGYADGTLNNVKASDEQLRPWYYTWSMLCRYFPEGSKVISVSSSDIERLRASAAIIPGNNNKNDLSIAVVNSSNEERTITLAVPNADEVTTLNQYFYYDGEINGEERPVNEKGQLLPYKEITNVNLNEGVTVVLPANSCMVLTTLGYNGENNPMQFTTGRLPQLSEISIDTEDGDRSIELDKDVKMIVTAKPLNTTYDIEWQVTDYFGNPTTKATITDSGIVNASEYGVFKVIATYKNDPSIKDEILLDVKVENILTDELDIVGEGGVAEEYKNINKNLFPEHFDGAITARRSVEDESTPGIITYHFDDITSYDLTVYSLKGNIGSSGNFIVEVSKDGNYYEKVDSTFNYVKATSANWRQYSVVPNEKIGGGYNYLRITMTSYGYEVYDPEYGGGKIFGVQSDDDVVKGVSITADKNDIEIDEQLQLTAKVLPSKISQDVSWKVYNKDGSETTNAIITETGLLTAKNGGVVVVEATAKDTNVSNYFEVIINGGMTINKPLVDELSQVLETAEDINRDIYTANSLLALDAIIEEASSVLESPESQDEVDSMVKAVKNAIEALVLKDADYSKVEEALDKVPADLSGYTEESVNALKEAVEAVVAGKDITEQAEVDVMAKAIEDALSGLQLKPVKPETGDNTSYALYAFAGFVSLLGLFFLRRKED